MKASAVSDVGNDTFERFGPESYLPSEGETEEGSVNDTKQEVGAQCTERCLWLLQKKRERKKVIR